MRNKPTTTTTTTVYLHTVLFVYNSCTTLLFLAEYATVGYMAKRIQMRKNRYQNLQKAADAKKAEAAASAPPPQPQQVSMPPMGQGGPPPGLNNGGMSNQP